MNAARPTRVQDYIAHILAAITRIESYVAGLDQAAFTETSLIQDAVIRNIEIIGEAANSIIAADNAFQERYPQLRLDQAYRMRNALAHGYYAVNLGTVWNTVQHDFPLLKQQLIDLAGNCRRRRPRP